MEITKIIYNEVKQETTVYFRNGDSVKVKKSKDTEHDIYSAVSAAVVKHIYGSNTAFKKQLKNVEVINKTKINLRNTSIFGMLFDDVIEETEAPKQHNTHDHLWLRPKILELVEKVKKPKPHKFKVGDKVKFDSHFSHIKQKGIGEIVEVNDSFITTYLVRSDDIVEGHDGNGLEEGNHTGCNHWWLFKYDLELTKD